MAGVEFQHDGTNCTELARCVISDIGAANTVACLPEGAASDWRAELGSLRPGTWLEPAGAAAQSGDDDAATKDWIAARLLAQFGRHFPQLATMVKFHEAATPLTQQRFTRAWGGSMYGLEMTGERLASPALSLRTPVPGLLLSGQDVTGPGLPAAFMAGMMAAAAVDPGVWLEMGR